MDCHRRCPICTSGDVEPLPASSSAASSPAPLVRCRNCRYIYRPQAERDDAVAPAAAEMERRLALLERVVSRGMLLDVGCGSGDFLLLAEQHGWLAAGVESVAITDGVAGSRIWPRVRPELGEGIWPASSFDAVTLWQPLVYCREPLEILRLAAYYCRDEGVLACAHTTQAPMLALQADGVQPHSITALYRLLSRFGFHIERIETAYQEHDRFRRGTPAMRRVAHGEHHQPAPSLSPAQQRTLTPSRRPGILIIARRRLQTPLEIRV